MYNEVPPVIDPKMTFRVDYDDNIEIRMMGEGGRWWVIRSWASELSVLLPQTH